MSTMDELGSAPRIRFGDVDEFNTDADQQGGSWFGLAISGLKFLINNQRINSINHNLQSSSSPTTPPNNTNANSANNNNSTNTSHSSTSPPNNNPVKKRKKLHILGPSVFKKHLYDIPEYQPTTENSSDAGSADKNKASNANYTAFKTNSRLTKQALQQFNGNFSNYWNQRASFRQYGSSNGDHGDDEAGSIHTNESHPTTTTKAPTDEGSSTVHPQTEEHHPLMTSSQIIHPTQDKPQKMARLKRSRSFPLLHSAEYIENFNEFSRDFISPNQQRQSGQAEATQFTGDYIPSPPPISNTPDLNVMFTSNLKTVRPVKSWESINSSNIGSVHSFGDEEHAESDLCADDGVLIANDTHFIRDKQKSSIRQKQWLRTALTEMKQPQSCKVKVKKMRSYSQGRRDSTNDSISCSTGLVHVNHAAANKANTSTTASEIDWAVCTESTIGQVIACPIPKSVRKNKKKKAKASQTSHDQNNEQEEDPSFSDWSNVSSNIGVNVASPSALQ